jgi:hypothetical protein
MDISLLYQHRNWRLIDKILMIKSMPNTNHYVGISYAMKTQ